MITIGSYLHRDSLRDLIRRWTYGNPHPTDVEELARVVYFNIASVEVLE